MTGSPEELLMNQRMDSIQDQLDRRIATADRTMDEIRNDVAQSLAAADTLETERIDSVSHRIGRVDDRLTELLAHRQDLLNTILSDQKEAVLKQEQANERRFEAVNEWRGQSADRERTQAEERTKLHNTFALKEVMDAQLTTIQSRIDALQSNTDQSTGQHFGSAQVYGYMFQIASSIIAIGAIVAILVTHGH